MTSNNDFNDGVLSKTPDSRHNCFPLKRIIVGTPPDTWMLFLGFIDIDFYMEIPSPRLSFTSFKIGPSTLQGPHQVAKNRSELVSLIL
jgi:hypothetical protein